MSTQSIKPPFPLFCDRDGSPLDAGYIYIGAANLPPQTNPIAAYWDADLTIPAAQPIRTSGGYPVRNGTPTRLYVSGGYSLLVTDSKGTLVYSAAEADGSSVTATVQSFSGNGATVSFTLAQAPGAAETLIVRISGVVQTPGVDFTVSGTTLTFTSAPPLGAGNIVVQAIGEVGVSGAGTLVNAQYVVYSDTTPLTTILTPLGLGGAIQVNTTTGAVSIGSNLGVVGSLTVTGLVSMTLAANNVEFAGTTPLDDLIGLPGTGVLEINPGTNAVTATGALTVAGAVTLSAGTANGVLYLNGSRVATSGSALVFDGTNLGIGTNNPSAYGNVVSYKASGFSWFAAISGANQFYLGVNNSGVPSLDSNGDIRFAVGAGFNEQMRLTSTGLGIGTASPGARLHSAGTSGVLLRIGSEGGSGSTDFWPALFGDGNTAAAGTNRNYVRIGRFSDGTAGIDAFAAGVGAAALGFGAFGTRTMTLDASGNWILGTAALATTATAGFPWIPSCAGIPTGAPTAPYTNAAAMVVDTTNNRLYVRVGSTWRYATLT